MATLKLVSSAKCFGGLQKVFEHTSEVLKCTMKFAVFLPSKSDSARVPVLYWLSGLTCTEQNFITKAGAQRYAEEYGIAIVSPDTSPRGCNIEGEEENWDFGTGAGFYVNATQEKWKTNYNMFSYVTKELPSLVNSNFPVLSDRAAISGHSMGGHGALICALRCPGKYKSVSALSPICNPSNCPWGLKAFSGYFGANKEAWKDWDACDLARVYEGPPLPYILIDQGKEDSFLAEGQLLPENLVEACREGGVQVVLRMQEGYDHSFYFVSTFIGDHIKHHASYLVD